MERTSVRVTQASWLREIGVVRGLLAGADFLFDGLPTDREVADSADVQGIPGHVSNSRGTLHSMVRFDILAVVSTIALSIPVPGLPAGSKGFELGSDDLPDLLEVWEKGARFEEEHDLGFWFSFENLDPPGPDPERAKFRKRFKNAVGMSYARYLRLMGATTLGVWILERRDTLQRLAKGPYQSVPQTCLNEVQSLAIAGDVERSFPKESLELISVERRSLSPLMDRMDPWRLTEDRVQEYLERGPQAAAFIRENPRPSGQPKTKEQLIVFRRYHALFKKVCGFTLKRFDFLQMSVGQANLIAFCARSLAARPSTADPASMEDLRIPDLDEPVPAGPPPDEATRRCYEVQVHLYPKRFRALFHRHREELETILRSTRVW